MNFTWFFYNFVEFKSKLFFKWKFDQKAIYLLAFILYFQCETKLSTNICFINAHICEVWIVAVVYGIFAIHWKFRLHPCSVRYVCTHTCEFFTSGDDLTCRHLYAISINSTGSRFTFSFKFAVLSAFPHFSAGRRAFEKKSAFPMNSISEFAQDVA